MLCAVITAGLFPEAVHANPINGGVEAPVPDVFSNYYYPPIPPGPYPGVGAQLYVSPQPVPARVGHTWVTYPPFMPHEFLYCLLYTSPSPRDKRQSRMPSSA